MSVPKPKATDMFPSQTDGPVPKDVKSYALFEEFRFQDARKGDQDAVLMYQAFAAMSLWSHDKEVFEYLYREGQAAVDGLLVFRRGLDVSSVPRAENPMEGLYSKALQKHLEIRAEGLFVHLEGLIEQAFEKLDGNGMDVIAFMRPINQMVLSLSEGFPKADDFFAITEEYSLRSTVYLWVLLYFLADDKAAAQVRFINLLFELTASASST